MPILMPMLMFTGSDDNYDNDNDGHGVGGDDGK